MCSQANHSESDAQQTARRAAQADPAGSEAPSARDTRAITCPPGDNFAAGITSSPLGSPDLAAAQGQHAQYRMLLERLGIHVRVLPADARYPDGCFVEDTAIVTERGVVLTRPGSSQRVGEVARIRRCFAGSLPCLGEIQSPGTVDGGDVLRIGNHFTIGRSARTNAAGAEQLSQLLRQSGFATCEVHVPCGVLHLKTGVTYVGSNTLVCLPELQPEPAFANYDKIVTPPGEEYAANCLLVGGQVVVPQGFDGVKSRIAALGIAVHETPMSEFQKMDGGLTCLSLRY